MDEETRLIRAGAKIGGLARTVNPPVQRGSTVLMPDAASLYDDGQKTYGLEGFASHDALVEGLCALEGARDVQLYPSGLAAVTAPLMALLKADDDILVVDSVYKPTRRFAGDQLARFGVTTRYYDPGLDAEGLMALVQPQTRLILLEAPGSLTFEMQDVPAIAEAARARGVLTMIDNTWAAGLLFKPLAHGVDISVQALTKYVGGHSDLLMGSAATVDPELGRLLKAGFTNAGWGVSADDAYLAARGLRTLKTRLDRHGESGLTLARWLERQPEVLRVLHPGLESDPGHALWKRDFSGASGLFGAVLRPASNKAVLAFLDALELFGLGFSWGGYESLAIHCDPQVRTSRPRLELGGPLIRLHVGLEGADDLTADLRQALDVYASCF